MASITCPGALCFGCAVHLLVCQLAVHWSRSVSTGLTGHLKSTPHICHSPAATSGMPLWRWQRHKKKHSLLSCRLRTITLALLLHSVDQSQAHGPVQRQRPRTRQSYMAKRVDAERVVFAVDMPRSLIQPISRPANSTLESCFTICPIFCNCYHPVRPPWPLAYYHLTILSKSFLTIAP